MAESKKPQRMDRPGHVGHRDSARDVLVALRRIIHAVDIQSKRVAKSSGLTTPQIVILQAVRDLGEVTAVRIAAMVNLSPATVATILDRLEQRGLIERYRSTKDRRVVHSRLTKIGRQALKKAPPLLHEEFVSAFSGLEPSNQKLIIDTLEKVGEMLGGHKLDAPPILDMKVPVPPKG